MFEKYGEVEQCNIMRDPHTKESRGFGFVKMVTSDQADAAKEGLQGEVHQGRTLSIEKARRARPRTPTPGKYYGPPKRGKYDGSHYRFMLTTKKSLVAAEAVDAEALVATATVTEKTAEAEVATAVAMTTALDATMTVAMVVAAGMTTALVV